MQSYKITYTGMENFKLVIATEVIFNITEDCKGSTVLSKYGDYFSDNDARIECIENYLAFIDQGKEPEIYYRDKAISFEEIINQ